MSKRVLTTTERLAELDRRLLSMETQGAPDLDGSYLRLDATNSPVTGTLTFDNAPTAGIYLQDSTGTHGYRLRANVSAVNDFGFTVEDLAGNDFITVAPDGVAINRPDGATIGGDTIGNAWLTVGPGAGGQVGIDPNEFYFSGGNANIGVLTNHQLSFNINGAARFRLRTTGTTFYDVDAYPVVFDGANDNLVISQSGDDFTILNDQQNNGIRIHDGTGGVGFQYNGVEGLSFTAADPPTLTVNNGTNDYLRIATAHGYADFGARNTGGYHIYTDRPVFYFNASLAMASGSLGTVAYPASTVQLTSHVNWGDGGESIIGSNASSYVGIRSGGNWRIVSYSTHNDFRVDLRMNAVGAGIRFARLPTYNNANGSMRWMGIDVDMGQAHTSSSLAVKRNVKPVRTRGLGRTQKDGTYSGTGSVFDRLEPIHFEYAPDHPQRDRWKGRRPRKDKAAEWEQMRAMQRHSVDALLPPKDDDDWWETADYFDEYEVGPGIGRMGFAYEQVAQVAPHFTYVTDGMEAIAYEGMLPDFMAWAVATIRDLRDRVEELESRGRG